MDGGSICPVSLFKYSLPPFHSRGIFARIERQSKPLIPKTPISPTKRAKIGRFLTGGGCINGVQGDRLFGIGIEHPRRNAKGTHPIGNDMSAMKEETKVLQARLVGNYAQRYRIVFGKSINVGLGGQWLVAKGAGDKNYFGRMVGGHMRPFLSNFFQHQLLDMFWPDFDKTSDRKFWPFGSEISEMKDSFVGFG